MSQAGFLTWDLYIYSSLGWELSFLRGHGRLITILLTAQILPPFLITSVQGDFQPPFVLYYLILWYFILLTIPEFTVFAPCLHTHLACKLSKGWHFTSDEKISFLRNQYHFTSCILNVKSCNQRKVP